MDQRLRVWLSRLGLESYASLLEENDVDFETLRHLNDEDLKELGFSLGHRRRLLAAISPAVKPLKKGTIDNAAPERRLLTVLFVDIVDSVVLSRQLDPEEMRNLVTKYQSAVVSAVLRYQGYVAKFLGDGVLAYFGWPEAHEDEAERAVRSAKDAFVAIREIHSQDGRQLQARAGAASGEVVIGTIVGDVMNDDAAIIGATPGLADRLQRLARPNEIVVGPLTRQLLGRRFEVEDIGQHELKGFDEPVQAWRVGAETTVETRFEASRFQGSTPLVGRAADLQNIRDAWQKAKAGSGRVVSLTGDPGIGKSRLVEEMRREISGERRFGYRYQCSPHHTNDAFFPLITGMRRAAGIAEQDTAAAQLEKLEIILGLTDIPLVKSVPLIASLLRVETEGRYDYPNLSPVQLRRAIIRCLIDQVLLMSAQHPIIIVIEDIHWADPSTLELLQDMISEAAKAPIMLLLTYRPEFQADWSDCDYFREIVLSRVGRRQSLRILNSVSGGEVSEEAAAQIVKRADGVPLYIEELTKVFQEAGLSSGDVVPATLHTSLSARLDRLGSAKSIAQIGSVIGREFDHEDIVDLSREVDLDCLQALEKLVDSGLILRRGVPPTASYIFKHALVQDAAYSTLLKSRRHELHSAFADLLESKSDSRADETAGIVAHHAFHGEDWPRAFREFRRAGEDAVNRSALREAAGQFRRALDARKKIELDAETARAVIDTKFALRNVLWALGQFAAILEPLDEAEKLSLTLQDDVRLGWVSVYRGASLWQVGRSAESKAAAERGRDIARNSGDRSLEVAADFYLGCTFVTSGELRIAERYFERVVSNLPGDAALEKYGLPFAPAIIARSWLVWSYAERGEFEHSSHHAEQAVALADLQDNPFNRAHIGYDIGYFQIVRGDIAAALETLGNASSIIDTWGLTYLSPFTNGFFGFAEILAGEVEKGLARLEQACHLYDDIGLGLFKSLVFAQLAFGYLKAGRIEDASQRIDRALDIARSRGERGHEAFGLLVMGEILSNSGVGEEFDAMKCFECALEISNELEMRPLAEQCKSGLNKIKSGWGQNDSGDHLSRENPIFDRLGHPSNKRS
ncbi:adenylate/guanylate cyclase domain-containing protein [uncultured Ruegeria sp.]|uniref:adenylate/guanylate cyclase domain-containing protein n=1 Tax=uncultured Ruegeria sp. TaxID=259304 RepID=UPI002637DF53|nr:adenylate/guanylate cyclase domain-containing protein [uncultured Ruegeria sp.]